MNRRHTIWVECASNVGHRPECGALCARRALLFKSKHVLLASEVEETAKQLFR